ncbi:MAG: hypothetical protein EHM58_16560 [Ignavibacteriae bacterium]|nr:MAG: hypothetical protein EHM58_16560 [Ignavibacteriota bacterium]
MQLVALKCPACGSSVKVDEKMKIFTCEYCKNTINIIKPVEINKYLEGLNEVDQKRYENFISIMEQAMTAGNYTEAYEYCNKGLEINPKAPELWANKAICSLWISTVTQITEDKALEIISYLNACKINDTESNIYTETTKAIGENLYYLALYRYSTIQQDQIMSSGIYSYSAESERAILSCIKILHLCFQLKEDYNYLIQELQLINSGKICWIDTKGGNTNIAKRHGFDAVKTREKLIEEIRNYHSIEKIEAHAKTNYIEFCKWTNEFYKIDKGYYTQYLLPIINKYKPQIEKTSPKQRRKNKIIGFTLLGGFITVIAIVIFLIYNYSGDKEQEKSISKPKFNLNAVVEYSDSIKALKKKMDNLYLKTEYLKDNDNTVFAQKTLILEDKNITEKKEKEIAEFYIEYYKNTAEKIYNNRFVLFVWFYTNKNNDNINPTNISETELKKEKDLFGAIIYNYDLKTDMERKFNEK